MSEIRDSEANMERCCIAQRPASVSRVMSTVETLHNTERQRGDREETEEEGGRGGGGSKRLKNRSKLRKIL